jgi:hypothetical protein
LVNKIGEIGTATTRLSLKGETIVVYGSLHEVQRKLERTTRARAEWFQPVWFSDEPAMPEPLALRITDVLALASADG